MFINDYYLDIPDSLMELSITSIYFVAFVFIVFVLSRTYKSILRPITLLVANAIFLISFSIYNLISILIIALISYVFSLILGKYPKKIILISFISLFVFILAFFKYINLFTMTSYIMPLGLSFYSFKIMSYLFDIYNEKIKVEKNIIYFLNYVTFFPLIIAGPINRAEKFFYEIRNPKPFNYKASKGGALQMLLGIFQKVVFVDFLTPLTNNIFNNTELMGLNILLAIFLYSFVIYLDFDALSNIAIGCARLLGFKIGKNFNSPYLASNLQEFWHRWHISLSTWFKDYLYIPLGGSRKGLFRKYLNIIIVFLVSGIWHGSTINFIVWGLLHGLIQVVEDLILRPFKGKEINKFFRFSLKFLGIIVNFCIVSLLWLIFKYQSMDEVFIILDRLFVNQSIDFELIGLTTNEIYWLITIVFIVISTDIMRAKFDVIKLFNKSFILFRWIFYIVCIFIFMILGAYGGSFDASDFIYQFF